MAVQVKQQLLQINRQFYEEFAGPFAASRNPQQPGLRLLLAWLPRQGALLDVGCGNGRLALLLDGRAHELTYLGLDASAGLLAVARRAAESFRHVHARFRQVDISVPGWARSLPPASFQAITLLSVLHHMPGEQERLQLLETLASLLAPDGLLAVSTWQFQNSPRLRRKIVPWSLVGLEAGQVEPGDYLLDWQRGGSGLRYCHLVDEDELAGLARTAGFHLRHTFYADGREGNLNLVGILASAQQNGERDEPGTAGRFP